ncbi:MAG TPA: hypothetical protein VLX31_14415 [Streptosporangiaceae bacterium]|nr:hypothetical protein [Streptosporangiaceae bacterium]
MFISEETALGLPFGQASARLVNLIGGGGLAAASHAAYADAMTAHLRVGPRPATKLVRVQFTEPTYTASAMRVGLRWEATGPAAGLFPVLDADITVAAASDHACMMSLMGAYRPPLGRVGQGLDRVVLSSLATATTRALLANVSSALAEPEASTEVTAVVAPLRSPAADSI